MNNVDALAETLSNVLAGRGHYEVHFPDGSIRPMTWDELHVGLKTSDPAMHAVVKYRWIDPGGSR